MSRVIANILSLTTPSDACRSSAVSWTFHAAAKSDIVWERFLPSDFDVLISRMKPDDLSFDPTSSSKKDIFFSVCDTPLLIDDGNKSFSLDIWSGKRCIMLGARDLLIVGSDTPDQWKWVAHQGSRFGEVAVLLNICFLEISGKISCRMLSPATTYAAYFVFKMKKRKYYGFNLDPVEAMLGVVGDECRNQHMSEFEQPNWRSDGWFEIELGEFRTDGEDNEVEVILREDNRCSPKSGLVVVAEN